MVYNWCSVGLSWNVFIYFSQHGDEVSPAASDLAMVLTRGLSMEQQKSNRDSLQYSSGYSTETTTPSCSEDTIPSQGKGLVMRVCFVGAVLYISTNSEDFELCPFNF